MEIIWWGHGLILLYLPKFLDWNSLLFFVLTWLLHTLQLSPEKSKKPSIFSFTKNLKRIDHMLNFFFFSLTCLRMTFFLILPWSHLPGSVIHSTHWSFISNGLWLVWIPSSFQVIWGNLNFPMNKYMFLLLISDFISLWPLISLS